MWLLYTGVDNCNELVDAVQENEKYLMEPLRPLVFAPALQHMLVHMGRHSLRQAYRLMQSAAFGELFRCTKFKARRHGPLDALDRLCYLLYMLLMDSHALHRSAVGMLLRKTCCVAQLDRS